MALSSRSRNESLGMLLRNRVRLSIQLSLGGLKFSYLARGWRSAPLSFAKCQIIRHFGILVRLTPPGVSSKGSRTPRAELLSEGPSKLRAMAGLLPRYVRTRAGDTNDNFNRDAKLACPHT